MQFETSLITKNIIIIKRLLNKFCGNVLFFFENKENILRQFPIKFVRFNQACQISIIRYVSYY